MVLIFHEHQEASMLKNYKLDISDLRWQCDPASFHFKTTEEIEPLDDVIGQERAVKAIEFGLEMQGQGYNVFVTGIEGTGKSTIVSDIVTRFAKTRNAPSDWCMVNNYRDEFRPRAVSLPSGRGSELSRKMDKLIQDLKRRLPQAYEDRSFQQRQETVEKKYTEQKQAIFSRVDELARQKSVMINRTQAGVQTVPLKDNQPLSHEDYLKLSAEQQRQVDENLHTVQSEIESAVKETQKINQMMHNELTRMSEEVATFIINGRIQLIMDDFADCEDVLLFLEETKSDLVENVNQFIGTADKTDPVKSLFGQVEKPSFTRYSVNVLVDHKTTQGAPVVFEANPTYQNVFGQIEKRAYMGTLTTDFTMIQAGSLLQANGGYLIMEIESLLMNPLVWEALKRALQNKSLQIEDVATTMGFGTASMRPMPIPLKAKVILIGGYEIFHTIQTYDIKFNKIFKVRADFDHEVKRSEHTIGQYAQFVARVCREEALLPFSAAGVASVVEFGKRHVSHKSKLSIRFGPIVGLIKEADYWARAAGSNAVEDGHVIKAIDEYQFRYNLYEEKMHESYVDDNILIDVRGKMVGQVNALAVYQIGEYSFGRPSRITAEIFMGKEGVINIEREAKLSGKTHDKGVLILTGYLGRTFAQKYPLSLTISITFEQSYGGIDGDSASSTELYAILSSLSGLPIRQGIAVTGSVNQKGEVQAIGGVNQKVEGFFEVCKAKGLTGTQGVMIPEANVKNLMLKKEVVDAVKNNQFNIYRVGSIEDGIEILTGTPAGKPDSQGNYPPDTVYGKAAEKIKSFHLQTLRLKKELES